MVARADEWETFLAVVVLSLALLYASMRSLRKSLDRVESIKPVAAPDTRPEIFSLDSDEVGRQTRALMAMSRPRPVRLTSTGRFYLVLAAVGVAAAELILLWNLFLSWRQTDVGQSLTAGDWALIAGVLLCLLVLALIPYLLSRQKNLVMNGDIGLATVVRQWRVRGTSFISYEMRSAGGICLRRRAADCTQRLYREMTVPVFYDPARPSRQVACCAAYYEVLIPDID